MIDFTVLSENFVVVVVVACLIVGYIIKHTVTVIPNKYIPTIVAIVGAVLNPIVIGFSVESVVYGALMGLASTGMHQAFKNFIEKTNSEENIDN